jgi:hypothetical protein
MADGPTTMSMAAKQSNVKYLMIVALFYRTARRVYRENWCVVAVAYCKNGVFVGSTFRIRPRRVNLSRRRRRSKRRRCMFRM